ncbi:MAG: HAD-IA family hydrolase [Gammaproteobacteria bacterium]|nr:HAD-IA family hydrolase [Gammaproteobacteria bacterium]
MYQLIIFDWDGTLMDSAEKISNCIIAAARDAGLPEPSSQNAKQMIGLSLHEAIGNLFPDQPRTVIERVVEAYKFHFISGDLTEQVMFDGVEQGLAALADRGALLAVATGKSRRGLQRVFDELDVAGKFAISRCADETRSKPHPQMLHEILDYTSIDPHNSIMIGDTTYDMQMAANAGITGLGAGYGVHSSHQLSQTKAIDVLSSFAEIVDWLLDDRVAKAYG